MSADVQAEGLTRSQLAARVLAWSELKRRSIEGYNAEKAALADAMEPGDTIRPGIDGSDPIGSVGLSNPGTKAVIHDLAAFNAWCIQHHPEAATVTVTIAPEAWPDGIDARDFDANAVAVAMSENPGSVRIDVTPAGWLVQRILDSATKHRAAVDHEGLTGVAGLAFVKGVPVLSARVTAKGLPILHEAMAGGFGSGVTLAELTGGVA